MDDDPRSDASDGLDADWVWIPNTSYGPFTFGTHRSQTPHVGPFIERTEMGPVDYMADYESERGDLDLIFWNDYLTSVSVRDTFIIDGIELIGANYDDIRHLVAEEPELSDNVLNLSAYFDTLNMMWFLDLDRRVTDVHVGLNPDTIPSMSAHIQVPPNM